MTTNEVYYSGQEVCFKTLPSKYDENEFRSPARSTVPSIAYWSTPEQRLAQLLKELYFDCPDLCRMEFEYQVASPKGKGKPSHTDLMLAWNDVAIGIEAKYTEGPYEKVSDWLNQGTNNLNREQVLAGWCDLIEARTGTKIPTELLMNLTYQMVHRLASVCSMPQKKVCMLYQLFNSDAKKEDYYIGELSKLRYATGGNSKNVGICLQLIEFEPSDSYSLMLDQWTSSKQIDQTDLITELIAGTLMIFEEPIIIPL